MDSQDNLTQQSEQEGSQFSSHVEQGPTMPTSLSPQQVIITFRDLIHSEVTAAVRGAVSQLSALSQSQPLGDLPLPVVTTSQGE